MGLLWVVRTFLLPLFMFHSVHCYWVGQKVPSVFKVKIKNTFFIFTKNFIEQRIHRFVPLPSAIFQANL